MSAKTTKEAISITPPRFNVIKFRIEGIAPLMQARFSEKAMQAMKSKQEAGSTATKGKKKAPRNFAEDFQQAIHKSEEGWIGIPAAALRNACIDVCRMVGFKMTHAKMSVFIESDGRDVVDGMPLVRLDAGPPEQTEMTTRNATGVTDIRVRPMWREWGADVRVRYDADQFTGSDVANLMSRAGMQVGIGEGRPFSKASNGLCFGMFQIAAINGKEVDSEK